MAVNGLFVPVCGAGTCLWVVFQQPNQWPEDVFEEGRKGHSSKWEEHLAESLNTTGI